MLRYVKHGLPHVSIPSLGSFETPMLPSWNIGQVVVGVHYSYILSLRAKCL